MRFFELLLVRGVLWVGLPILLVVLAVGPQRFLNGLKRGWRWLWQRRLEPEQILSQVVKQYETLVVSLKDVLAKAEVAEQEIVDNIATSETNVTDLEAETKERVAAKDDLGARAAVYKLNLEQQALVAFRQQLSQLREQIAESRKRLFMVELQLRQYEVGRRILLTQLAEAKGVEQQYAIASNFDPFNAVADWQRAEGMVHEKALVARAKQRVHADTNEFASGGGEPELNIAEMEAKLAELRAAVSEVGGAVNGSRVESRESRLREEDSPRKTNKDVEK